METEKINKQSKIVEALKNFFLRKKVDFIGGENRAGGQPEDIFQAFQQKKEARKRAWKIASLMFVVLLIAAAGTISYLRNKNKAENVTQQEAVKIEIPAEQDHVFVNDVEGVMPITDDNEKKDSTSGLAGVSENYRLKDVSVGGFNALLAGDTENLPLEISDVRSETLMSKDGKEIKMLVSWKTNKLAKSQVEYSKNGGIDEKKYNEDGYGFSHALVMNKLDSSTRYLFTVNAADRTGNKDVSEQLAVFTGAKPVSVFELIASQFGDIFGWAMKK